MSTFWRELQFGWRLVCRSPGASLLAVVALGLGIGANTAIFSVADGLILRPLPFPSLERILSVRQTPPNAPPNESTGLTDAVFNDWLQQSRSFDGLAAYQGDQMNLSGLGAPEMVQGYLITPNFFDLTGVKPMRGRTFLPQEARPGADRETVISQSLWRRHFGGDPNIVGKQVSLDTETFTIVGIMNDDAVFPQNAALWMPLAPTPDQAANRDNHRLQVLARLKPGVSEPQAASELNAIAARLGARYPATDRGWGVKVETLAERTIGNETRQYIELLLGAVGFLLLIACANVANLQFARVLGRNHELAIRTALGAQRWRLVRQMLTENLLLGLGGAVVGIAFAWVSLRVILACMPADIAQYIGGWTRIRLDLPALLFTFTVAVGAGLLSGLAPAWQASSPEVNLALKDGGRGTTAGPARQRLRSILVVAQVALALILLVGAGLMVRGFRTLIRTGDSYQPDGILTADLNLPGTPEYRTAPVRRRFYDITLAGLTAIPGVESAALATSAPMIGDYDEEYIALEGQPATDAASRRLAIDVAVTPAFFSLLRLPLLQGRAFTASDGPDSLQVAIVSREMARKFWPGRDPIGQRLRIDTAGAPSNPWMTVVGIAADAAYDPNDRGPESVLYQPTSQNPSGSTFILLRGAGDVMTFGPAARGAVLAADANQPLFLMKTLARAIHDDNVGLAYVAVMMAVAGILALILAAVGVYGVMDYMAGERVHEIGIRMALGAERGDILALLLRRGALLLAIGLLLGYPVAFWLARLMSNLIYGIGAGDPVTFAGIGLLLAFMAGLACFFPARHASRVDPNVALREG